MRADALGLYVCVDKCNFEAFMLLVMYLLYRYAQSRKGWSYLFDVGLFVVLVSLISTLLPLFLSFPFYLWYGKLAAPAWLASELRLSYPRLPYHSVRFLTVDLNLTPDWELSGGQIIEHSLWSNYDNVLAIAFSVFLLINFLGGTLGYVIGRKRKLTVASEERWAIVGVTSIAIGFVLLLESAFPLSGARTQWMQIAGILSASFLGLGTIALGVLAFSVLIDYVKHARLTTLMVMAGLVLFFTGHAVDHVLMRIIGQTLVVFGGIIYFLKIVIAYTRTHPPPASPQAQTET